MAEMDACKVLSTKIDLVQDINWNESSDDDSEDDEEMLGLPDSESNAEV